MSLPTPYATRFALTFFIFAGFAASAGRAADPGPTLSATLRDQMRRDLERIDEFFDTRLPGTLAQYNVVLKFSPKFGDLRDHEFVRYPFELRYGLNDHTEIYGGM